MGLDDLEKAYEQARVGTGSPDLMMIATPLGGVAITKKGMYFANGKKLTVEQEATVAAYVKA